MFLKLAQNYNAYNKANDKIEIIEMQRSNLFGSNFGVLAKLKNTSPTWITIDWFFPPWDAKKSNEKAKAK